MNLSFKQFLNEVRYAKPVRLAVFELTSDRYGEGRSDQYIIDTDILRQAGEEDDEEKIEELLPTGSYKFLPNVIGDIEEIEQSIRIKGGWATEEEDLVIAISAKGPKHAKLLALNAYHRFDDNEEEDWF